MNHIKHIEGLLVEETDNALRVEWRFRGHSDSGWRTYVSTIAVCRLSAGAEANHIQITARIRAYYLYIFMLAFLVTVGGCLAFAMPLNEFHIMFVVGLFFIGYLLTEAAKARQLLLEKISPDPV